MFRACVLNDLDDFVKDKAESTRRLVRVESGAYLMGYSLIFLASLLYPRTLGSRVLLLWILPHCIGAGHLRCGA